MKKIFLSIAIVATTFAIAQKKEISAAYKAIEANDTTTANAKISEADALLKGSLNVLEPEVLEQYYYAKGLSLVKTGKVEEGANILGKVFDLRKEKIYTGKDASKTRVYYVGKQAADASGISGLKEETYAPKTLESIAKAVNPLVQNVNKQAVDLYNAKNYASAAPKFVELYSLLKAGGQDEKRFLYNAGITYLLADKKQEAVEVFTGLINDGYTGVETTYTAKNKKSGETEQLDKSTWELYKKMGAAADFSDFKEATSPSVEPELYERTVALLIETGKYDEAIALVDKGIKKYPNEAKLVDMKGVAYYKAGKTSEFIATLKAQLAKNPNNRDAWYNLGVLQSKDPATVKDAIESYKKAIEIDPKYINAYQNLTYTVMGNDEKAVDEMNAARKAGKTELFNKLLQERRNRFVEALPYAEKWYAADPKNLDVVSLLKGFYISTKNDAKAAEFKAKEAALSK